MFINSIKKQAKRWSVIWFGLNIIYLIFHLANTIWKNSITFFHEVSTLFRIFPINIRKIYQVSECTKRHFIYHTQKGVTVEVIFSSQTVKYRHLLLKLQNFKRVNKCFYHNFGSWSTVHTDVNERFNAISQVHLPLLLKQLKRAFNSTVLKAWFVIKRKRTKKICNFAKQDYI